MNDKAALRRALAALQPTLHQQACAFVSLPHDADARTYEAIATLREREGLSAIVPEHIATANGLPIAFRAARITLGATTDLSLVGLLAAVATALAHEGIACNAVAGTHHDDLFVPFVQAEQAMRVLATLGG